MKKRGHQICQNSADIIIEAYKRDIERHGRVTPHVVEEARAHAEGDAGWHRFGVSFERSGGKAASANRVRERR